jgi:multimeric flavodoxin WrbA
MEQQQNIINQKVEDGENLSNMKNIIQEEVSKIRKMMLLENLVQEDGAKKLKETLDILKNKKKVLILSCSNRYNWDDTNMDIPKSKLMATYVHEELGDKSVLIDVTDLKIFPCEGNVSRKEGNSCGVLKSKLKDKEKNPSGEHRCWASLNNKTDELWKISKELFESDAVIFFSSIRWGQTNMYYQNLIERLTWLENRHSSLGESNLIKDIETGFICVGQNWNGEEVTKVQMKVHEFYGFKPNKKLYWNWQYTTDVNDETQASYKKTYNKFIKDTKIPNTEK